jgi:hypothetical protein
MNRIQCTVRRVSTAILLCAITSTSATFAQSRNLAPGFEALSKSGKIVIMPTDIELFSISGGGVLEPKADWTEAASRHFKSAFVARKTTLGVDTTELAEKDADELAEVNHLHGAIARAIAVHHFGPGVLRLPTKADKLDWSLGEPVRAIKEKTGADYALFSWIRDSYASGERVATMIALAIFGIGVPGGSQTGYASLVDLNTGQVVWFNRLMRASGDMREAEKAAETLNVLLNDFPAAR